jgi:hypothetical protein
MRFGSKIEVVIRYPGLRAEGELRDLITPWRRNLGGFHF